MFATLVTCLALQLAGGDAGPEIVHAHATYGHLGAVREKGAGILPGDRLYYTFGIKNLVPDDEGQFQYSSAVKIQAEDGTLIFEQQPFNAVARSLFGGDIVHCSSFIDIPLDTKAGGLMWEISIVDRVSKKSTKISGKGKVRTPEFGIVRVGTYADPAGNVPAPAVGVVGEQLFLKFAIVGFGRDKEKLPDIAIEMRILDAKGKPTLKKPLTGRVKENVGIEHRLIPLNFALTLDREGDFTIELSAKCQLGNSENRILLPIRVLPLE